MPKNGPVSAVIGKFIEQSVGQPIVNNVLRGMLIESIVALELEPEWKWTGGSYGGWDFEHANGLRLEIKQSAAQQSWQLGPNSKKSPPKFDIALRKHRGAGGQFVEDDKRAAQLYLFAYHPVEGEDADHREPDQWEFYLCPEKTLPRQKSIRLSKIRSLCQKIEISKLRSALAGDVE